MALLQTTEIIWPAVVTLLASYQLATFAKRVGESRRKFKIDPPTIEGDPEFVRTFRAQQNSLEFFGIFIATLWVASIFFHQVGASCLGLVYCYGRQQYFNGYIKDAKQRIPGFKRCVQSLQALLVVALVGVGNTLLHMYMGVNLRTKILG